MDVAYYGRVRKLRHPHPLQCVVGDQAEVQKNERRIAPLCRGPNGRSITVIERGGQPPLGRTCSARSRAERVGYGGRVARRDGRRALRWILPTVVGDGR